MFTGKYPLVENPWVFFVCIFFNGKSLLYFILGYYSQTEANFLLDVEKKST